MTRAGSLLDIELFQTGERVAVLGDQKVGACLFAAINECNRQDVVTWDITLGLATENNLVTRRHGKLGADEDFNPAVDDGGVDWGLGIAH